MKLLQGKYVVVLFLLLFMSGCDGGSGGAVSNGSGGGSSNGTSSRDHEGDAVEQALIGQKILFSWREGEAVYGTYSFEEYHFCNRNNYLLVGYSERNTILDNVQRNSWQNEGRWEVRREQGQIGVFFQPNSGQGYFYPLRLESNGRLTNPYASVSRAGRAACR